MAQLGKYSADRDNILHTMALADWANESFGDVESPTGYVWRISNTWGDVSPANGEFTGVIADSLEAYDIEDTPEFRQSLVGHFLVIEDSNGFVSVLEVPTERDLLSLYSTLQGEYEAWADTIEAD